MENTLNTGHEQISQMARPQSPLLKFGKVISVHREDNSVDVAFLDSNVVTQIPVLSSFAGSNFGLVNMVGPSYDQTQLAKKTYPDETSNTVHADANESQTGRDVYALVLQAEGSGLGTAKMYVVGFAYPQVSEMLFPRHEIDDSGALAPGAIEGEFEDMLLYRHPSDVQTTMDRWGKVSLQHPNGSRITMGTDTSSVDLIKKDYDKKYELRHNLEKDVSIYIEAVDADGHKRADVFVSAGGVVHAIVYDASEGKKADLMMSSAGEWLGAVYAGGEQQTARVRMEEEGKLEGYALKEVHAHNAPGCFVKLKENGDTEAHAPVNLKLTAGVNVEIQAGANVEIDAGAIVSITGGSLIQETAPLITLN